MGKDKCVMCGENKNLKRGWTYCFYCSSSCETRHVSFVHKSMPGSGRLPRVNWVPSHIAKEIHDRWEE